MNLSRLGITAMLFLAVAATFASADDRKLKEEVVAAWTSRAERFRSTRFEWREISIRPAGSYVAASAVTKMEIPDRTVVTRCTVHALVDNEGRMRCDRVGEDELNRSGRIGKVTLRFSFDGDSTRGVKLIDGDVPNREFAFISPGNELLTNRSLAPLLWFIGHKPFQNDDGGDIANFEIVEPSVELAGTQCVQMFRVAPESGALTRIWLDRNNDYALVRLEQQPQKSGPVTACHEFVNRRSDEGLVIPKSWGSTTFRSDGRVAVQKSCELTTLDHGALLSPDDFKIAVPEEIEIQDFR